MTGVIVLNDYINHMLQLDRLRWLNYLVSKVSFEGIGLILAMMKLRYHKVCEFLQASKVGVLGIDQRVQSHITKDQNHLAHSRFL